MIFTQTSGKLAYPTGKPPLPIIYQQVYKLFESNQRYQLSQIQLIGMYFTIILAFVTLSSTLPSEVRFVGEFPLFSHTIFQLEYPQLYIPYVPTLQKPQPSSSSSHTKTVGGESTLSNNKSINLLKDNLEATNKDNPSSIKNANSSFLSKIMSKIRSTFQKAKNKVYSQAVLLFNLGIQNQCNIGNYMFQQQLSEITRITLDGKNLLPGWVLQLKDRSNFAKGIEVYKNDQYTRHKLAVKLSHGLTGNKTFLFDPKTDNLLEQIYGRLSNNLDFLNSQPIKLYIEHDNRLEAVLRNLGLSSRIYEMLKLAYSNDPKKMIDKRIVVILHQSLFSAALDLTSKIIQRDNPSFFSLIFDKYSDKMLKEIGERIERDESTPMVITQANFGRLLIFALQEKRQNHLLVSKLANCFSSDRLYDVEEFKAVMRDITTYTKPRYFYAGVELNNEIREFKTTPYWQDIFFPITNSSIYQLEPLSASGVSLTGQPRTQCDRRYFQLTKCTPKIELKIISISSAVIIEGSVVPSQLPNEKHPFNLTHPGTFEISSLVGSRPFELNLVARQTAKLRRLTEDGASYGIKFFFLKKKPVYSIQAEFALLINGEQRLRHVIGNSRSDRQFRGVIIRVDPNHLYNVPLLQEI